MLYNTRRYRTGGRIVAVLVAPAFLSLTSLAYGQNAIATVAQATGNAQIERGGTAQLATPAMPVELHDTIRTGPGSEVNLNLGDGSRLSVGPSATMRIDQSTMVGGVGAPNGVDLQNGRLHAEIVGGLKKAAVGGNAAFEVTTPNAVLTVMGTNFDATYSVGAPRPPEYPDCTQFTDIDVTDGLVHAVNAGHPSSQGSDVEAGKHLTIACDHDPAAAPWWDYNPYLVGGVAIGVTAAVSMGICASLGCISDSSPERPVTGSK